MLIKVNEKDLIFTNELEDDRTNTYFNLTLADYDWMNYNLETRFKTKEMGTLEVTFEYFGVTSSFMLVKQYIDEKVIEHKYSYPTDIYKKYIIRFLEAHIKQWEEKYSFNGEEYVIDFFNEVLDIGKLE